MTTVRDMSIEAVTENEKTRLQDLMTKAYIPGMSMASISEKPSTDISDIKTKKEFKIEACAFGVADAEAKTKVTPDTPFWACSLSKPVFAYLVTKLSTDGNLGNYFLDKPLPWDEKRLGPQGNKKLLTARMILTHQTGLPNEGPPEFKFNPGEGFRYSGTGYVYLQNIIKEQTGKSLEELAKTEIFDPLGMTHSTFLSAVAKNPAKTHDELMNPLSTRTANNNAAGSLHTTASDYARFLMTCLKDKTFLEITKPQIITMEKDIDAKAKSLPSGTLNPIDWGLGFGLQKSDDQKEVVRAFHWGHGPGERAFFVINLTSPRSAMVYLANSENGLAIAEDVAAPSVGNIAPIMQFLSEKYGYRKSTSEGWVEYHQALTQGVEAEKKGELTTAVKSYKKAAEIRPEDKQLQYRTQWAQAQMGIQSAPVVKPPNPTYAGQYGKEVKISVNESKLQIEVGGQKRNLVAVDENTFLDGDVILKLSINEKGNPSLQCLFPNGAAPSFEKMSRTAQILNQLDIPPTSIVQLPVQPIVKGMSGVQITDIVGSHTAQNSIKKSGR